MGPNILPIPHHHVFTIGAFQFYVVFSVANITRLIPFSATAREQAVHSGLTYVGSGEHFPPTGELNGIKLPRFVFVFPLRYT